eukprot:COSAG02_NODE_7771_length_2854_cov_7.933575_6_plen_296_part_01
MQDQGRTQSDGRKSWWEEHRSQLTWITQVSQGAFVLLAFFAAFQVWDIAGDMVEISANDVTCVIPADPIDNSAPECTDDNTGQTVRGVDESWLENEVTLRFPLIFCQPSSIKILGAERVALDFDNLDVDRCQTAYFLVAAVGLGNIFGSFAVLAFLITRYLSRHDTGPSTSTNAVVGVGMFLVLILVQTSASTFALARLYGSAVVIQDLFYKEALGPNASAEGFASIATLKVTAAMALVVAFLAVVETVDILRNKSSADRLLRGVTCDSEARKAAVLKLRLHACIPRSKSRCRHSA